MIDFAIFLSRFIDTDFTNTDTESVSQISSFNHILYFLFLNGKNRLD